MTVRGRQLPALEPSDNVRCSNPHLLPTTEFARDMLKYEKARFGSWCSTVDSAITAGLQQPLLAAQAAQAPDCNHSGPAVDEPSAPAGAGQKSAGGSGPDGPARVVINFPSALLRLMREAKYLDQLGLAVPPLAVNLALQQGQIRYGDRARVIPSEGGPKHLNGA